MFFSFLQFFKSNKISVLIILISFYAAIILVMAVFSLWDLYRIVENTTVVEFDFTELRKNKRAAVYNILNGTKVNDEAQALISIFAVSIDNYQIGKQSGLDKAQVIFEIPVEGGVTRFLAFFDGSDVIQKIGPVRSLRPYFIEYADGLAAMLVHAGGSPQALAYLTSSTHEFYDLDEIGPASNFFWRDQQNLAPHNLFTSSILLRKAYEGASQKRKFMYKDISWEWEESNLGKEDTEPMNEKIFIDFSTQNYEVEYRYDKQAGYIRYQGEKIAKSLDGQTLVGNNIIIIFVQAKVIDTVGRLKLETEGGGEAVVCKSAKCTTGKWEKKGAKSHIKFKTSEGVAIKLDPGITWIEVVPVGRTVRY